MSNIVWCSLLMRAVLADVGDPQVGTEHPWYPGEAACATFERLFATQEALYTRVTGRPCASDEDRALASWLWRNTHYWHGEEGGTDLWGQGPGRGPDNKNREYWTGLFAHGFGLCGTTHAQWVAEMQVRFGPGRARSVGTVGHVSFEVLLTGGAYGAGRWALLDHDLSTVIFAPEGSRLLGIDEVAPHWQTLTRRDHPPNRLRGWLPCGLHPGDGASFAAYASAEYASGYAGPPPVVHLRRGETFRRYLEPGLDDGRTFVFWGRNYGTAGIPGPERSRTWVNQPERMFRSTTGTPHRDGQARFGNAVFVYRPDFVSGDYQEAVVDEGPDHVVFEFGSPYVIAATPPSSDPWGIYQPGCRNGLVLTGRTEVEVSVSLDRGATWQAGGKLAGRLDLTDLVKGRRQYWLRLHGGAAELRGSDLVITTVCQANPAVMPQLTDQNARVSLGIGRRAVVSAGPELDLARAHVVDGAFGSPKVTLRLATPRREPIREVYAAAHVHSGNPPDPRIEYHLEYSTDEGRTWQPLPNFGALHRHAPEPGDFWSQSLCWGFAAVAGGPTAVQVRFRNTGGKRYARAEVHAVYQTPPADPLRIAFGWADGNGTPRQWEAVLRGQEATWTVPTTTGTRTRWVELAPVVP